MTIKVVNKSDFELPSYATKGSAGMDVRADLKRYMLEHEIGVVDGEETPTEIVDDVMELKMLPHQQYVIPTGLFFALPEGYVESHTINQNAPMGGYTGFADTSIGFEIEVRPRSGLAAKFGVTVLNSPGTLDEDYRGELKIILICHNYNGYIVRHGDRIAQILFKKFIKANLELVETLDETERGAGGFGHTGLK